VVRNIESDFVVAKSGRWRGLDNWMAIWAIQGARYSVNLRRRRKQLSRMVG